MKQRVEDLGRIHERLEKILEEYEIFHKNPHWLPSRPKDTDYWMEAMSNERKIEVVQNFAYQIDRLRDDLTDLLLIASGDIYDCD